MIDARGNPVATHSTAALEHAESALWRMMSFYDVPIADLDAAIAADPGWALPHAMKAGFLLSLTEPSLVPEARGHLDAAQQLAGPAAPREKAHLEALRHTLDGRWAQACRIWDELLIEHPCDALALQWTQLWDFYRGDAPGLRGRPARALPQWDAADPLYPCVLGLYAFGLEESNLYAQAEEVGRRALESDPRVPWAIHAVAHVMEMQGRFEEGAAWMRHHRPAWADGNGFAIHLWWHSALFRLEGLDLAGVVRLVDNHLSGEALQVTLNRVDAAAMLWRLHLLGTDVHDRFAALLAGWDCDDVDAGYYAFNDVHRLMAMIGCGQLHAADAWIARCAERAMRPDDAGRANHGMAREVGLPLMRGLMALARGDAEAAAQQLYPVRSIAQRFGGSHAQRDLIDQTLLAAAARSSRRSLGQALVNERLMAKPETPLTRYWIEELGLREDQLA
jgi:tetratricopeptide (TPR) repeat protein